jgi:hypothetical protein
MSVNINDVRGVPALGGSPTTDELKWSGKIGRPSSIEAEPTAKAKSARRGFKPIIGTALLIASFIYLSAAIPAGHGRHRQTQAGDTAVPPIPPRLFDNGEIARIAATGRKVVVQSAVWDSAQHCYIYTCTPLPDKTKHE